jgi:hypothetical protein
MWPSGPGCMIQTRRSVFGLLGSTPSTVDLEPEQDSHTHDVLVEEVTKQATIRARTVSLRHPSRPHWRHLQDHVGITEIGPVPVNEKESLEVSELSTAMYQQQQANQCTSTCIRALPAQSHNPTSLRLGDLPLPKYRLQCLPPESC